MGLRTGIVQEVVPCSIIHPVADHGHPVVRRHSIQVIVTHVVGQVLFHDDIISGQRQRKIIGAIQVCNGCGNRYAVRRIPVPVGICIQIYRHTGYTRFIKVQCIVIVRVNAYRTGQARSLLHRRQKLHGIAVAANALCSHYRNTCQVCRSTVNYRVIACIRTVKRIGIRKDIEYRQSVGRRRNRRIVLIR